MEAVGIAEARTAHVHPGAATLARARMEVAIDACDDLAVLILHIIIADIVVPHGNARPFDQADAV